MKNMFKLIGIIVLAAVIGFSFAACGGGSGAHTHSWGDWRSNASQHWKECDCGEEYGRANHTFSGNICSVCNYNKSTGEQEPTPGGDGGGGGNTSITIVNNTTYAIMDVRIKPSTSNAWGDDLESNSIVNGSSRAYTISRSSVGNKYDIRLMENSTDTGGNNFRKYNVTVSNGMTVTFNAADLDNGSNLPVIYIRNRTGIAGTSFRLRPSGTSDWTTYPNGAVSNNNDANDGKGISLGMSIPLSSYSVFDFELLSANPVNTFTKNSVTIANGTILTFTSAQAATPIVGYPTIVIENNTDDALPQLHVRKSGTTSWGANLTSPGKGKSLAITLSESLSANNVYDIRLYWPGFGTTYMKENVTVTEGMIVTFTSADKR